MCTNIKLLLNSELPAINTGAQFQLTGHLSQIDVKKGMKCTQTLKQ